MERRFITNDLTEVRIERRGDDKMPLITGYAAVYYDGTEGTEFKLFDDMVERIMPGAFDRVARENDVRGVFNHDPNQVLGRNAAGTMRLMVDAKGLRYEIEPPDTQLARDLVTSIERGDITGSSFAFTMRNGRTVWVEEGDVEIRQIEEIGELFDVGPVTFPAYEATTTGVRDASDATEARKALEARKAAQADLAAKARQRRARIVEMDAA